MKYEVYTGIEVNDEFDIFEFVSTGKNGAIKKRVAFAQTDLENVYNLAMGDVVDGDELDDLSITDNGDRNKILATIADIVDLYTRKFPERWVLFRGVTPGRTRLYQMAISINLEELSKVYEIQGYIEGQFDSFRKDMRVSSFLIKRKKS
jgi:hypothetical protein